MIVRNNGSVPTASPQVINLEIVTKRMTLDNIRDTEERAPEKIVLYAQEGWGKSSWAANAEKPIFISTENGLKRIKAKRFPNATSWGHITEAIDSLRQEEHDFKTLCIDTVDWAETLCHAHLCRENNKSSISEFGYGEGFGLAFDEFKKLLMKIDLMQEEKEIDVIFLAHAKVVLFKNPLGEDYDRFEMKTHKYISTFLREWADCVLFGSYDMAINAKYNKKNELIGKAKAIGGIDRIIQLCHHAAWDAKNRYDVVSPLPVPKENPAQSFWKIVKGEKI